MLLNGLAIPGLQFEDCMADIKLQETEKYGKVVTLEKFEEVTTVYTPLLSTWSCSGMVLLTRRVWRLALGNLTCEIRPYGYREAMCILYAGEGIVFY